MVEFSHVQVTVTFPPR